jgi:hypothetical protein
VNDSRCRATRPVLAHDLLALLLRHGAKLTQRVLALLVQRTIAARASASGITVEATDGALDGRGSLTRFLLLSDDLCPNLGRDL